MYDRLKELKTHARQCAKIGYREGAERWLDDAVRYGTSIGRPVSPAFQKGIGAKARTNARRMDVLFRTIDEEVSGR